MIRREVKGILMPDKLAPVDRLEPVDSSDVFVDAMLLALH